MENHQQRFDHSPDSFNMIAIEGGLFEMGEHKGTHPVSLTSFWMCEHPVTQAVWQAVMGEENNHARFKHRKRPVEQVSWQDITKQFLPKLNQLAKNTLPKGTQYRLPTEAEWEYAAKGGVYWRDNFPYSGGHILNELGWYSENSYKQTKPVGLKGANKLGLYDMSGNVWEWCHDWYASTYYQDCLKRGTANNPKGPEKGIARVLRGGSWSDAAGFCRPTIRGDGDPTRRTYKIGFRLLLSSLPV